MNADREAAIRGRIENGEYPAAATRDQREGLVLAFGGDYTEAAEGEGTTFEFPGERAREPIVAWVNGAEHDCACNTFRLARKRRFPCPHIWAVRWIQQPPQHVPPGTGAAPAPPPPAPEKARPLTPALALFPDMPDSLTQDADAYQACLDFAYARVAPMLRSVVQQLVDTVPQNPRGRKRKERRDGLAVALLGVARREPLRQARASEVTRFAEIERARKR